jgi:signal transduction histidine kinase
MRRENIWKLSILSGIIAITVAIHYGWVIEPIFGHSSLAHAIHSRLCYIPIVVAASWYGFRGGTLAALAISILIQPYIFLLNNPHINVTGELVEIVFYFAIGSMTGAIIDRESEIRKRQEETQLHLERSHKLSLIGQMAAGVAHEIKNPLASIKGAVEIMGGDQASDAEKKEFQGIVIKEIKRIDAAVAEFLDYARPREIKMQDVNLSEIVRRSCRQLENQIEKASLKLSLNIAENVRISADAEKIHQALLNLTLNAIEASSAGGEIKIELRPSQAEVILTVADNGSGISESDKDKIFDPFFTTKAGGSGLGLPIVKSIIERHNGRIELESQPGRGTKVLIRFPRVGGET